MRTKKLLAGTIVGAMILSSMTLGTSIFADDVSENVVATADVTYNTPYVVSSSEYADDYNSAIVSIYSIPELDDEGNENEYCWTDESCIMIKLTVDDEVKYYVVALNPDILYGSDGSTLLMIDGEYQQVEIADVVYLYLGESGVDIPVDISGDEWTIEITAPDFSEGDEADCAYAKAGVTLFTDSSAFDSDVEEFTATEVPVSSDGSCVITYDIDFSTENEYAYVWLQDYSSQLGWEFEITKVTMTYAGEEVDITDYLSGDNGNYMYCILDENDNSYLKDRSTLDQVTAISYYLTLSSTDFDNNWYSGAVGYYCTTDLWTSVGLWTTSSVDEDAGKDFYLYLSDTSAEEGESDAAEKDILLGDVNNDDKIDYLDAMQVLRYDAELIELDKNQLAAVDVNGDGNVNSLDAILILRYDADLISSFE